jgi:uncharacterized protein YbjT (DUF2867 family)
MEGKTAIVLGATGLTGGLLVDELIRDDRYGTIKLFSRGKSSFDSPKIQEFIGDLLQLESFQKDFTGDVVFCCIGTTKAKTKDQKAYKAIDHGIPVAAAKLAKQNGIDTIAIVSAIGANPDSSIFYNRTKGEMERDVLAQEIPHTFILQPSLITGDRKEKRSLEKFGAALFKVFRFLMFGPFKKYRAIDAIKIAQAMIRLDNKKPDQQIIESHEIAQLADQ